MTHERGYFVAAGVFLGFGTARLMDGVIGGFSAQIAAKVVLFAVLALVMFLLGRRVHANQPK